MKSSNTTLNRIGMNIKQLGDILGNEQTPGTLYAIAVQLEGYSKIVEGYAMKAEEK